MSVHVSHQAIYPYKLLWALSPGGQLHIRDDGAVLHHSQVVTVGVDKHLREVVELWDQLLGAAQRHIYTSKQTLRAKSNASQHVESE